MQQRYFARVCDISGLRTFNWRPAI